MSLGAATLADLFDPAERGTVMGVYYIAPLLGPSLGSIVGGALAQAWGWRADFWFLAIWSGACFLSFIFIKDTFRKERSLTYQAVLRRIRKEQAAAATEKNLVAESELNSSEKDNVPEGRDTDIERQLATGVTPPLKDVKITVMDVNPFTPIKNILRRPNNVLTLIPSGTLSSSLSSNYRARTFV
jgi:MFS family permease